MLLVIGIGEKTHISASNPFDDLQQQPPPSQPSHHNQHPPQHQYHVLHQPYNQHQQLPPPHQNRPNYQYHAQYSTSSTITTTTPPGTYDLLQKTKKPKNPNRSNCTLIFNT